MASDKNCHILNGCHVKLFICSIYLKILLYQIQLTAAVKEPKSIHKSKTESIVNLTAFENFNWGLK